MPRSRYPMRIHRPATSAVVPRRSSEDRHPRRRKSCPRPRGVESMADRFSRRHVLVGGLSIAGAAVATPVLAQTAFAGSEASVADVGVAAVSPDELPWPEAKKIVAET